MARYPLTEKERKAYVAQFRVTKDELPKFKKKAKKILNDMRR